MVLYEVNLNVNPSIRTDYLKWLYLHVEEILKLPGFEQAELFTSEEYPDQLVVHYYLDSSQSLSHYLEKKAPQFRKEAMDRFGSHFKAERRILLSSKKWKRN